MRDTPLVHPDLEDSLDDVQQFPSLCTIQAIQHTLDDYGQEQKTEGDWSDVGGHVDIPCRLAAHGSTGLAGETERQEMTFEVTTHRARLKGYWPNITASHSAVVDGQRYDIQLIEHSSEKNFTSLRLQWVR